MPTPKEIEDKFWSALKSDMTMMLGLDGVEDGHARPMTAQLDGERGPIWFFTSRDNTIVQKLGTGEGNRAIATFTSKDHDLFATVHGGLTLDNNPATIDRLWNRYVAAWFEGGKAGSQRSRCCASTPSAPRSGSMPRASSRESRCCSAPTPSRNTRTRWPR